MNTEDVRRLTPIIEQEARTLALTNSGIEVDDLQQEMWLHLTENWKYAQGKEDSFARMAARKAGIRYCKKEQNRYEFYSAQYVYSTEEVRLVLSDRFFDSGEWEEATADSILPLLDVQAGYDTLTEQHKAIIYRKYVLGEELDGSGRMTLTRAVDNLTRALNHKMYVTTIQQDFYEDGPGSRVVLNNGQAQAMTGGNY